MQSQTGTRKRPAPGTSPLNQQQASPQINYQYPNNNINLSNAFNQPEDSGLSYSLQNQNYDPPLFPANPYPQHAAPSNPDPAMSNQLVRRNMNQQIATRNRAPAQSGQSQWDLEATSPQMNERRWEEMDDESELDQKAALAKKDAQAKRKQIPPFVLKLWSFLDDGKNTDLIKWTDNGTAFTVLDEDEFARTLIPELFKHNNYASFVRQLNMYGFHKKVGLNANSMKAAEKKTKDPNVYWHEYFRQGREDLLWLIQKPQSKSAAAKRKRGDEKNVGGDSDDEGRRASPEVADGRVVGRVGKDSANSDMITLPKSEMSTLRAEIQRLQRQQNVISKMIAQLKDQNEQFYRQATEFQSLHDRHENSINAILTFLATFYNKSLEAGVDLNNMFGNNLPQHGTVVDVGDGDFADGSHPNNQQVQRYRRPQLLLQDSTDRIRSPQVGSARVAPASARSSTTPAVESQRKANASLQTGSASNRASVSPAMKDDADTPNLLNQFPESDDMMSLINAANANTPSSSSGPNFDFSSALNHAQTANGSAPLTPQQRDDMLNLIANQAQPAGGRNNALMNPNPPPMPSLDQYNRTQEQLNMLTKLQREQDSKVQDLAGRLQPLSPTGGIPGIHEDANLNGPPSSDFDLDAFINSDPGYFNDFTTDNNFGLGNGDQNAGLDGNNDRSDGNDDDDPTGLNFDFGPNTGDVDGEDLFGNNADDDDDGAGGGRIQSLASSANSASGHSPNAGETPSKKQRLS